MEVDPLEAPGADAVDLVLVLEAEELLGRGLRRLVEEGAVLAEAGFEHVTVERGHVE